MTRRSGTSVRARRKPVVVVAGEDKNDRACLRVVLEEVCPDMRGRIVEINDSVRLRQATGGNLEKRANTLARQARARAARENADLACVFVHEDFDSVDDDKYPGIRERVDKALAAALGSAHYVLAVWEIEAWLLLFPSALSAFVSTWKVPVRYRNRNSGLITDPKRVLRQEICSGARTYRESDAAELLRRASTLPGLESPEGSNRSWDRLCQDVKECGSTHLPRQRRR